MCSTMLIPRLSALLLAGAFDPYSTSQIPHLVDMAEQLEAYVGSDNVRYLVRLLYSILYPQCPHALINNQ